MTSDRSTTRWHAVTDWLGAQKPLNLILGAVLIIQLATLVAHTL